MAKTKISEFSVTPGNNTDIDGINIAEGCAPSGINDAIRELMSQLKDFQAGTAGDSFNGPVGTTTAAAGAFTTLTTSSTVTHNGGTANGVAYLNGSKVLTTGSALTFDGTNFATTGNISAGTNKSISLNASSTTDVTRLKWNYDGTTYAWIERVNNSGDMAFGVQSSEAMRLTSTGLGIGTSSPDGVLTIPATNSNTPRFRFQHPTNDADASIDTYQDGGGTYLSIGTNSYQTNAGALSKFDATKAAGLAYFDNSGAILFYNATSGGSITEKMRLDSSGNLGLGVTPSAWSSSWKVMQLGGGTTLSAWATDAGTNLSANAYNDGSWKRINAAAVAQYSITSTGEHRWNIAGSSTAGSTITFTQAMTLDASGHLMVGTTSGATKLDIRGTSNTLESTIQIVGNTVSSLLLGQNADGGVIRGQGGNNALTFWTGGSGDTGAGQSGTERARINSGGNLLVGATAVPSASVAGFCATGTSSGNITSSGSSTSAYNHWVFYNGNGLVGYISTSGSTTTYSTSSDHRLKENIQPMTGALAKVAQLKPCTYNWKADGSAGEGFIAHELQAVVPQCVTGEKDAVDAEGKPVYQGIDTSFLVATLTAALQELKAEFDAYKATHP